MNQDPQHYVIPNKSNALGKGTFSAAGFKIQPCLDDFEISLWPFVHTLGMTIMVLPLYPSITIYFLTNHPYSACDFFFPTDKSGVVQHSHSSLITLIIALSTSCATWYISHSNLCFGRLHILRTYTHYIHTVLPLNTILFFLSHMDFLNKSPFSLKLETGHEEIIYNVIYKCLLCSAFSTQGKGIANLLYSS